MVHFKTELILWLRNFKRRLHAVASKHSGKSQTIFNLIIGLLSIYFAYEGYQIANAALNLSVKDTRQQIQIDQLKELLYKQDTQVVIGQAQSKILIQQNERLIEIANASKRQDSLTNELISGIGNQAMLTNEQLSINKKTDSSTSYQFTLQTQARLTDLWDIFYNLSSWDRIWKIDSLVFESRAQINEFLDEVIKETRFGLSNPLVLTHKRMRGDFYKLYKEVNDFKYIANSAALVMAVEFYFAENNQEHGPGFSKADSLRHAIALKDTLQFQQSCKEETKRYQLTIGMIEQEMSYITNEVYLGTKPRDYDSFKVVQILNPHYSPDKDLLVTVDSPSQQISFDSMTIWNEQFVNDTVFYKNGKRIKYK